MASSLREKDTCHLRSPNLVEADTDLEGGHSQYDDMSCCTHELRYIGVSAGFGLQ